MLEGQETEVEEARAEADPDSEEQNGSRRGALRRPIICGCAYRRWERAHSREAWRTLHRTATSLEEHGHGLSYTVLNRRTPVAGFHFRRPALSVADGFARTRGSRHDRPASSRAIRSRPPCNIGVDHRESSP